MDLPEWLNETFIEKVLQNRENDNSVKLLNHHIEAATNPGDNFASIALRLRVKYVAHGKQNKQSFIVKVEPYKASFQMDVLSDRTLFQSEIALYSKIIPEMQRLLQGTDDQEIISPPLTYASLSPQVIFLDDISPEFTMIDKPLNFENSVKLFQKIGKFHALSFYMNDNNVSFDQFSEGYVSERMEPIVGILTRLLFSFAETFRGWGEEMELISQKYFTLIPKLYEKGLKLFSVNPRGYNVLNHGDFHIKNILFRIDKDYQDQVDDIRLIDFQLCLWASPAIDLIFALYAIVGDEARDRREELVRIYHNQFSIILNQLGYLKKIPSLLDLQVELLQNGVIEVLISAFLLPILYSEKMGGDMDMTNIGQLWRASLESPALKAVLLKVLPVFLYKGFLD